MLSYPLLSVPCKKLYDVDYVKPLKKYVAESFGAEQEKELSPAIEEFNNLRGRVCSKHSERSEALLELYNRYYDQLVSLEPKAVICVGGPLSVHFKWQRAFERDPARKNIALQSSAYEKMCVLFNIGAIQSQLAEVQNRASDDGLKQCSRYLQQAAGTFQFLREQIASPSVSCQLASDELHMDLHGDLLAALVALMVAQAQDCLILKARSEKMKDAALVKLAAQCRDLYAEFAKLAGPFREALPRDWFAVADAKKTLFCALAEFYAAREHVAAQEIGKAIARLGQAQSTLSVLAKAEGKQFAFTEDLNAIRTLLESTQKDNSLVYHDKVADFRSLPPLDKVQVAKPVLPKSPFSAGYRDLFEKLVPIRVHSALKAFEARLNEAAAAEVRRLREATGLLNSVFASLGLPSALEEVLASAASKTPQANEPDLPDSVREKAAKVRELGGISSIREMLTNLPEILEQNRAMITEIAREIEEEESADRNLRQQFGTKWTRTPSDKLNASFRTELGKYRTLIENAASADTVVRERYGKLEAVVELLARSDDAIRDAMPERDDAATLSANQLAALATSDTVLKLKDLCDRAHALKTGREELEHDLATLASAKSDAPANAEVSTAVRDVFYNMRSSFLGAIQADGTTIADEENIVNERIADTLRGYRELIQSSVAEQSVVLGQLQDANNAFVEERSRVLGRQQSAPSVNLRAAFLQNLHSGYDGFVELRANIQEGTKFYSDLLQILIKLQQRVQDFCFGRKIEKDEALADLTASAARNAPVANVPVAPTPTASAPPQPSAPVAPSNAWQQPRPPTAPAYPYPSAPAYVPYAAFPQYPPATGYAYPPPTAYTQYPQYPYAAPGYPPPYPPQ